MNAQLRSLIESTNPWLGDLQAQSRHVIGRLPDPYITRTAEHGLAQALEDTRRAHLVIGPRQAGKSTLVWSVLSRMSGPLLLLNCEEPLIRQWCDSPGLFAAELGQWLPPGGTVFFEEAQWLREAGLFIKGLVDAHKGRRIVVTGSASFHLAARTRESLAGRATRHQLWPLSLAEAIGDQGGVADAVARRAAREVLERHLVRGGYPAAWTAADPVPVLQDLVTSFVLRDASDRFRIERPDAFRRLLQLAAGQIGDVVNYSEWARITGIATSTVIEYASLLEETHILRLLRPFIGGKRAELTQAPKVFYIDVGLRNAVGGGFASVNERVDIGKLLEGVVFGELHKRWPEPGAVRYWRTRGGAEVDFVLEPEPGRIVGLEVKASARAGARLSRSARSFIAAYGPALFLLVHRGEPAEELVDGVTVRWVPAELLPETLDSL